MTLRKLLLTACAVSACGPGEGLVHATWSGTLYGEPSTADLTMKLTESRRYFIEAEEQKDARLGYHRLFQQKALVL